MACWRRLTGENMGFLAASSGIAAVSGVFDLSEVQKTYVNNACKMTPESAVLSPIKFVEAVLLK